MKSYPAKRLDFSLPDKRSMHYVRDVTVQQRENVQAASRTLSRSAVASHGRAVSGGLKNIFGRKKHKQNLNKQTFHVGKLSYRERGRKYPSNFTSPKALLLFATFSPIHCTSFEHYCSCG